MIQNPILQSKRLRLRQWQNEDLPIFAALNADPDVMTYFPKPLSRLESDAMADKNKQLINAKGWGFWAVEVKLNSQFIGFVGIHKPIADLPFSPCVEIGWRLHKAYWGNGYATEAAQKALRFAFGEIALDEVVSFTAKINLPSQAVMQRLGMDNTGENFYHPAIDPNHPLAEHVLYKISKEQWLDLNTDNNE